MKNSRRYIVALLLAVAGAAAAGVQTFNTLAGRHRELVHEELQRVLGKEAGFEKLEASFFNGFGFSAKEFRIADNPRFAATPFVRAKELVLGVSLWDLFLGRVVINSLTLRDPEFQVITDEAGLLNLSVLASQKPELDTVLRSQPSASAVERKRPAVSFRIAEIRIRNGRVEYLDRSVQEPAEMQVKNVEMKIKGLDPRAQTTLTIAAAITEGLGHDVHIDGQWAPAPRQGTWAQRPIDLSFQFDSLHLSFVARAIAFLRNKIPRELDVAGPMSLQARLSGSLEQPRITDIVLKAPLFGASDYNAFLQGTVDLSKNRSWADARLEGTLALDPVDLNQLRGLPLLKQILPAALTLDGPATISSRFEGTWNELRLGALVRADKSAIQYRDLVKKPPGSLFRLRGAISRRKNGIVLHETEVNLDSIKMLLSGVFEETPGQRSLLRVRGAPSPVAPWSRFLSLGPIDPVGGRAEWDIVFEKDISTAPGFWNLRGLLKLAAAEFRNQGTGRRIANVNANVVFQGRQARVDNATLQIGSSKIAIGISAPDLAELKLRYLIRAPDLDVADLPAVPDLPAAKLKDVTANGAVELQNGVPLFTGSLFSPAGTLQRIAYQDLRADMAWSATGVSFKNFSLRMLHGTVRSEGYWASGSEASKRFAVTSKIDSIALAALLEQKFPLLKNRIEGELTVESRLNASARTGESLPDALKGSGEATIARGAIRNFNLVAQLFKRAGGSATGGVMPARLPASLEELITRLDTPFDTLKATFTIDRQRLLANDLLASTPDYELAAAGWVAFDGTTRWNGLLILAPRITQEFLRQNRMIRYLLDRRGRLAIPFRLEGTLPELRVRADGRAVTQALRRGSLPRAIEPPPIRETRPEPGERREALPDALEQLLHH